MLNLFAKLLLGVLFGSVVAAADVSTNEVTPQQLFAGRSEGNGSLTMLFGEPQKFHVESDGQMQPDGSFQLNQTITFEGKPASERSWHLRTVSPGIYAGTLSDAAGEVTGRSEGNRLLLRYRINSVFTMHQTLELMADGESIDNVGKITLLGIPIGRLRETIVLDAPTQ